MRAEASAAGSPSQPATASLLGVEVLPSELARADGARRLCLCTAIALAAWAPSIALAGLAQDDLELIGKNPLVNGGAGIGQAFARDFWHHVADSGLYRPLVSLSLRLDHILFSSSTAGFHVSNVLLHAASVAMAGLVLLFLGPHSKTRCLPWLGLAVFAAHPALADSVAWIAGRSSSLSALLALCAMASVLVTFVPWRPAHGARLCLALAGVFVGCLGSLCSKEDGLVLLPAVVLIAARHSRRLFLLTTASAGLALACWIGLRMSVFGSIWPNPVGAPLAPHALAERLAVGGRSMLEGLRLVAWPAGYPPAYDRAPFLSVAQAAHTSSGVVLASLGFALWSTWWLASLALVFKRPRSVLGWSSCLSATSCIAYQQWLALGAVFAPRFLYLPLLLGVPLLSRALESVWDRFPAWPRTRSALGGLCLAGLLVACWQRSTVYADRASYARAILRQEPRDYVAWNNWGVFQWEQGEHSSAESAFRQAVAFEPAYSKPYTNLGGLAFQAGELASAQAHFERAAQLEPDNAVAWCNLGRTLLELEQLVASRMAYERATASSPGLVAAWRGLARAAQAQGDLEAAHTAFERALELDPSDALARKALGRD